MTTNGAEGAAADEAGPHDRAVARIRKPFDLDTVRSVIDRLLGEEKASSGNAT